MELQRRQFTRERAEQSEIAKQNPIDWATLGKGLSAVRVLPMRVVPVISTDPITGRKTQE
jgi:hypothetical protein